jgi:L-arabinokinase
MSKSQALLPDLAAQIGKLRKLSKHRHALLRDLLNPDTPIFIARAPGRLDVMGGIADYSGSLVLEMPIAEAAFVAVQRAREPGVVVVSNAEHDDGVRRVELTNQQWDELLRCDYDVARTKLRANRAAAWAAYILGPILVLLRETSAILSGGLRILVDSRVPEGKGVSSSAALEVATIRAAAALVGQELDGEEIARLAQKAENLVVGAPCGIMDQMTSALGRENELLALRCQPEIVEGFVPIPKEIAFWGVDSGIRHAVTGSDYASVRVGAFMGYRMIAEAAGLQIHSGDDAPGYLTIDDRLWNGYLANITPAVFYKQFDAIVPAEISGREFLRRYGGTTDRVTRIDPERNYAVRRPTLHPITENERVRRMRQLLGETITEDELGDMGVLMTMAHNSYSACGLGSHGTDLLVELVSEAGPASGLYGAKITGGGSGGTVAILGRADASAAVERVAEQYAKSTGRAAYIFRRSSPGACATDVVEVHL